MKKIEKSIQELSVAELSVADAGPNVESLLRFRSGMGRRMPLSPPRRTGRVRVRA